MTDLLQTAMSVCAGVGLAAACGFRIFLPCLAAGLGQRLGFTPLEALPDWLASTPALVLLACATAIEVGAYYLPWIDNMLDSVASPAAVIAGALLFAGVTPELDPAFRWVLAMIAGGAAAGTTQTATVLARGLSLGTTGGVANPLVSSVEAVLAAFTSAMALLLPPLSVLLLFLIGLWAWRAWRRRSARARPVQEEARL